MALREAATLRAHKGCVNAVKFNADGQYCMTAGDDRRVLLWNPYRDPAELSPIKEYCAHNHRVLDIALAAGNASFASCGGDRAVFLWDVASGAVSRRLQAHEQRVNAVAFNDDCSVLLSASYDKTVRCWDMRSRSVHPVQSLGEAADSVSAVASAGHFIYSSSIDGCVRTYDLRQGALSVDSFGLPVTHLALSHDGNCLLAATLDSTLRLLDKANGQMLTEYSGHRNESYKLSACFSHDDAYTVGGSEDGSVHVWDLVDAKRVLRLTGHRQPVCGIACHPKRFELLTCSHDGTAKLWRGKSAT
ncbi:hypothetical protein AB1Y20_002222 [Prymnesium parvum]|uniref:Guanine nucleotide-binding protein subunit beta-like protein n=1 Tax=Prymnesium parvum TaxID=97485 RepID=A0AB34J7C7_PRYPA